MIGFTTKILTFGLLLGLHPSFAADTTLVTRLEYQNGVGTTLSFYTFQYDRGENGTYYQHQLFGSGASAKPVADQKFNAQNQVINAITYDSLGKASSTSNWKYNSNSKLIQFTLDQGPGNFIQIDYALLSNGSIDSATSTNATGTVTSVLRYAYNSEGRLAEERERHGDTLYLLNKHNWSSDGLKDTVYSLSLGIDTVQVRFFEYDTDRHITLERVRVRLPNGTFFNRETRSIWENGSIKFEDQYDISGNKISRIAHIWGTVNLSPTRVHSFRVIRRGPIQSDIIRLGLNRDLRGRTIMPAGFTQRHTIAPLILNP